jgi:DNA-binding transcriptional ArsR family regulator
MRRFPVYPFYEPGESKNAGCQMDLWTRIKQLATERSIHVLHKLLTPDGAEFRITSRRKKGETFGTPFTYLFHRAMVALMNEELTGYDYRLFLWLVAAGPTDVRLGWDGWKTVNSADVLSALGGSQPTVSRSLARLCSLGMLERESRGGGKRAARYRLHEQMVWRGTTAAYWQHVAKRRTTRIEPPGEAE